MNIGMLILVFGLVLVILGFIFVIGLNRVLIIGDLMSPENIPIRYWKFPSLVFRLTHLHKAFRSNKQAEKIFGVVPNCRVKKP